MDHPSWVEHPFHDWEVEYRSVLRDYGTCFIDARLHCAITACMDSLVELPQPFNLAERRACLTALSDLLTLRSLQYRYGALHMVECLPCHSTEAK